MACRKQFPAERATPRARCSVNVFFIITVWVIKPPLFLSLQIPDYRPNAGDGHRALDAPGEWGGMIESMASGALFRPGRALTIGCWVIEQLHLFVCVRRA